MGTIELEPYALTIQDPNDKKVYFFDWDAENLGVGVTIIQSSFTISALTPSTTDALLSKDQETLVTGNRITQVRLFGGTRGQVYEIANQIITSESPAQTKERSFRLLIQDL